MGEMLGTVLRMYVLPAIIIKVIFEAFLLWACLSIGAWSFDQEQCRKPGMRAGGGEGQMPGAREEKICVTWGTALYGVNEE